MECPVCHTDFLENSQFCNVCAFDNTIYVSDISEQERKLYHQKLQIAQKNWKELNKVKNQANIIEKLNKNIIKPKTNKKALKPNAASHVKKVTDSMYSDKTGVPELNRDPFEDFDEFETRINNYPPVPAGIVTLIKKKFSFHIGEFPVEINWEEWTQNIEGLPSKNQKLCIHVSPEIAQELYQSNKSHKLYVKLKSIEEHSALDCIEIFWKNQIFPIDHYIGTIRPFNNETETDYEKRILSYNDIYVGRGTLIKEKYEITTGIFPLELKIGQWIKDNFTISTNNPYIIAERDIARDIYENSRVYPIKARFKKKWHGIAIEDFYLYAKNMSLHIENIEAVHLITVEEPTTQMEFIYVPGGTFQMGDFFGDGDVIEKPVHEVTLDSFCISKYPVTQGQWKAIMKNNPSKFKKGDNYPVEWVSWNDAQKFIKKINKMNINNYVFRLPTEAEWEYAARSGGKKEKYAGGDNLDELAWYSNNSNNTTHPVGKSRPNGLGLYDMSGNVWEWCADIYSDNAYSKHSKTNPVYFERNTGSRVLRGGSWKSFAKECQTNNRDWHEFCRRSSFYGFRIVASPRSVI